MTDNIWGYLWGKLAYGAMLFAQALGQDSIAGALANPALFPLWRGLGAEVMAVADAEGVRAEGFNGFDPDAFGRNGGVAAPCGSGARRWTCRSRRSPASPLGTASPRR
jgi:2-dehydropantoate 2-reductase